MVEEEGRDRNGDQYCDVEIDQFELEKSKTMFRLLFVSSRRRHTRWPRDWSSDVCSSDLPRSAGPEGAAARRGRAPGPAPGRSAPRPSPTLLAQPAGDVGREVADGHVRARPRDRGRSEERRVGKRVALGGGRSRTKERRTQ